MDQERHSRGYVTGVEFDAIMKKVGKDALCTVVLNLSYIMTGLRNREVANDFRSFAMTSPSKIIYSIRTVGRLWGFGKCVFIHWTLQNSVMTFDLDRLLNTRVCLKVKSLHSAGPCGATVIH